MKAEKIHGKKVITYKGLVLGEVSGVEIDENTWAVKEIDVALSKEVEKLFNIKAGFRSKIIVPIPASLLGPIGSDSITLNKEIEEPKEFIEKITKE